MSDAELKQLNTALNRNREHRETIKRLTKELEAYKAEDTPAFEEVCMRNQALTADLAAMTADRDRLREVVGSCHSAMCSAVHELESNPRKHLKVMLAIQQAQPIVNAAREQQADAKGGA